MKAKVIETGEIVNVTPYPTWYQENGQGPDRREWDEDELEFIYSDKKEENLEVKKVDFHKELLSFYRHTNDSGSEIALAKHFFELGLKAQKGE